MSFERSAALGNSTIINRFPISRTRAVLMPLVCILCDYCAVLAAVWTAFFLRAYALPLFFPSFDVPDVYMFVVIPMAFIFFLHFDRLYIRRLSFAQQTEKIFKVSVYSMILVLAIMYFTGAAKEISRVFFLLAWIFSFIYLSFGRYALGMLHNSVSVLQLPVIFVGAGKTAELLLAAFQKNAGMGYKVIGFVEDNPQNSKIAEKYPILGSFDQAESIVQRAGVKDVFITAPGLPREELLQMVYRLQPYVHNITLVPDLFGVPVAGMELETLFHEKTVLLKVRNNLAEGYNRILKLGFDFIAGLVCLFLGVPILLIIAIFIFADSPGSVMFSHTRIGRGGKTFPCYKFRTMVCNAGEVLEQYLQENAEARAEWERDYKLKDDPRVTRVGRFLRKTSLDELPQIINVLKGEMSLVGPRPIVREEIEKYGKHIADYFLVRPGITGMWQVSGRNDIEYPERVEMDSGYVRNWSLWLDITILVKTIKVVFSGKGAY